MFVKDGKLGSVKDNVIGLNVLFGLKGFVFGIMCCFLEFVDWCYYFDNYDMWVLEDMWW